MVDELPSPDPMFAADDEDGVLRRDDDHVVDADDGGQVFVMERIALALHDDPLAAPELPSASRSDEFPQHPRRRRRTSRYLPGSAPAGRSASMTAWSDRLLRRTRKGFCLEHQEGQISGVRPPPARPSASRGSGGRVLPLHPSAPGKRSSRSSEIAFRATFPPSQRRAFFQFPEPCSFGPGATGCSREYSHSPSPGPSGDGRRDNRPWLPRSRQC